MKDFTYIDNGSNLHAIDCEWLRNVGLRETRWILDREWFIVFYDKPFSEWIK